jgi:hypothetical protein
MGAMTPQHYRATYMANVAQAFGSIFNTVIKSADLLTNGVDSTHKIMDAWNSNADIYRQETIKRNKIHLEELNEKLAREAAISSFKAHREIEEMMKSSEDSELFNQLLQKYSDIVVR